MSCRVPPGIVSMVRPTSHTGRLYRHISFPTVVITVGGKNVPFHNENSFGLYFRSLTLCMLLLLIAFICTRLKGSMDHLDFETLIYFCSWSVASLENVTEGSLWLMFCFFSLPLSSIQILYELVTGCLSMASQSGFSSIAFPALGTGQLGYPRDTVAQIMLTAIDTFGRNNPSTSLREIRIVLYQKDQQTIQVCVAK